MIRGRADTALQALVQGGHMKSFFPAFVALHPAFEPPAALVPLATAGRKARHPLWKSSGPCVVDGVWLEC